MGPNGPKLAAWREYCPLGVRVAYRGFSTLLRSVLGHVTQRIQVPLPPDPRRCHRGLGTILDKLHEDTAKKARGGVVVTTPQMKGSPLRSRGVV